MNEAQKRAHIIQTVVERLSLDEAPRHEALCDVLSLGAPDLDADAVEGLAAMIPPLPSTLYTKWAGLFADRLLETVAPEQVLALCDGTEENRATLLLVYTMFMESQRMEKVVAEDLRQLGVCAASEDEVANVVGVWLKQKMAGIKQQ